MCKVGIPFKLYIIKILFIYLSNKVISEIVLVFFMDFKRWDWIFFFLSCGIGGLIISVSLVKLFFIEKITYFIEKCLL